MTAIPQDLRYGARMLIKKPGLTLAAIITLALGIGANTAIFSVVNSALLTPLPYPEPEQIVRLFESVERESMASERMEVAPANYLDWREENSSFSNMAIFATTGLALSEAGEAERIEGALVSIDYFSVLGARPHLGRTFSAEDEQSGNPYLGVISFDLWQRRFGGTTDIVGRKVQLDGHTFTIIGVMERGFHHPQDTDLWELWRLNPNQRLMREARFLKVIARLKSGTSIAQAQSDLSGIARRLAEQYPQTNRNWGARVVPLLEEEVGAIRPALLLLLAAVGLVLIVACANVGSLLLARAAARQSEISIRLALGASRWRIVRQLLTESTVLAAAGGLAGLMVGVWGLEGLLRLAPKDLPRLDEIGLDWRVFAFTLVVTLLTGLLAGLAPALQTARQDVQTAIKEGGLRAATSRRSLFAALVSVEIALALVVICCAGLLVSSFWRLQQVDPGIEVERLLAVEFEPPSARYNGSDWQAQRLNFWNRLSERVASLPGVEAVGAIDSLPLSGRNRVWRFRRASDDPNEAAGPAASFQVATRDYFRAAGIRLQRGRLFGATDYDGSAPVAVINETMARRFWPNAEAVGERIVIRNEQFAREIVGVVSDVKHFGLEHDTQPEMYVPFDQFVIDVMPMVVRVKGDPAAIIGAIREQVRAVDPAVAISRIAPMQQILSGTLARRRFTMSLLGVFAILSLLVAAVGIYGVTSYSVAERTREIGIRLALGAQAGDVRRLVIGQGVRFSLAGIAMGLAASFAVTRLMQSLLYGVSATDPVTFAGVALLLAGVVLLASYLPARRATKVDPTIALRYE